MLKIITAVFTVLTLLLMLVTGFTLWGTLAFLLAAAALVCVCFFGKKLSGKMAFIGVAVAAVSFLVSALFGAPGMPHFNESAQSDILMTEENQGDNDLWDSVVAADIDRMILDGKYDEGRKIRRGKRKNQRPALLRRSFGFGGKASFGAGGILLSDPVL